MHHIYHTQALILRSRQKGEANKMIVLYTKELGLVHAATQGIRLLRSKLRFALQDFSIARVDLVRGKDVWRITSATPGTHIAIGETDRDLIARYARVFRLLEKLCAGEESNPELFDDLMVFIDALKHAEFSARHDIELHIVFRMLFNLGYIAPTDALQPLIASPFGTPTDALVAQRRAVTQMINDALRESQLLS
jgi:DNA repair protein RecO (recombination protein O)